jgi:hypothetical protein
MDRALDQTENLELRLEEAAPRKIMRTLTWVPSKSGTVECCRRTTALRLHHSPYYPAPATCAARRLRAPREDLTATSHGFDEIVEAELAIDLDGRIRALKAEVIGDVGAYSIYPWTAALEPVQVISFIPGPYRVPTYSAQARAVATNKAPTGPYRGAARIVEQDDQQVVWGLSRKCSLMSENTALNISRASAPTRASSDRCTAGIHCPDEHGQALSRSLQLWGRPLGPIDYRCPDIVGRRHRR